MLLPPGPNESRLVITFLVASAAPAIATMKSESRPMDRAALQINRLGWSMR
jgi:hypothetical protein